MQTDRRIVIVEDEADLAEMIAFNLGRAGFDTQIAASGPAALRIIRQAVPDLVILDVMLPQLSGLDVARELRKDPKTATLPILMLTARAGEGDQLAGLEGGADDYMTKPFSLKVLLARIEVLLRRAPGASGASDLLRLGPIEADLARHEVRVAGAPMATTLTEFRILTSLMRSRERALTRYDLMSRVMGPGVMVTARTIDVHIAAIRKKLGVHGRLIRTIRGVGYLLSESAEAEGTQGASQGGETSAAAGAGG